QRFLDARLRFGRGGPRRKLREPRPRRTPGGVKVADYHVIEQHVVQTARAESSAHQVRMDVQNGERRERFFAVLTQSCRIHHVLPQAVLSPLSDRYRFVSCAQQAGELFSFSRATKMKI